MKTPFFFLTLLLMPQEIIPAKLSLAAGYPQKALLEPSEQLAKTIPVPDFERYSFLNGMDLLFLKSNRERLPFVLMIANGAAFDPPGKWGVTYLTVHSLLAGDPHSDHPSLFESLKDLGTDLKVHVSWDAIYFIGESSAGQLERSLAWLADRITQTGIEPASFDTLRQRVRQEVQRELQQVHGWTEQRFRSELFGGNPYAHPVKGTPETLADITVADIKIQHRKLFLPNQAQLATYWGGDANELFGNLAPYWGAWTRSSPMPFTFRKADPVSSARVLVKDDLGPRGELRWGILAPARGSRSFYAAKILEQYLRIQLPSWLEESDRGAPDFSVELRAEMMPGYLQVRFFAPPERLVPSFERFDQQLGEVMGGQIDESAFERARQLALQEFHAQLADPEARLHVLLQTHLYNLGIGYIANYGRRLNRVRLKTFQDTVAALLSPTGYVVIISGPKRLISQQLESLPGARILN